MASPAYPGSAAPAVNEVDTMDQNAGFNLNDPNAVFPGQPEPEYLLMEWLAESRVVRKRSKEYYSSLLVIVLLVSLILFFANQVLLIFVILSMLFITYVLSSVKAETVHHMITTYGIRYRDRLYYWEQLGRFWVRPNGEIDQVHIELPGSVMGHIILLPANEQSPVPVQVEDIVDILGRYLVFEEPLPSQIDRWVEWVERKFPLEPKRARTTPVAPMAPKASSPNSAPPVAAPHAPKR